MNLAAVFNELAGFVSSQFDGPFHAGQIIDQTVAVKDAGGSIVTPGAVVKRDCLVQIDVATEAMRGADGYADGDVRFLVLSGSFTGALDTDARVSVNAGVFAGTWTVSALERDPAGIGYAGRGRRE